MRSVAVAGRGSRASWLLSLRCRAVWYLLRKLCVFIKIVVLKLVLLCKILTTCLHLLNALNLLDLINGQVRNVCKWIVLAADVARLMIVVKGHASDLFRYKRR
ncbi:hypothetical protein KCU87_g309, partial [Aureobasidium melanogenum]